MAAKLLTVSGARGAPDHSIRDQIVVAATEHFRLYGFEKTTVSDLASAIGYSKAYIYKFFDSKQAIGEVICANCVQGIMAAVEQSVAGAETASDQIRQMFRSLVDASVSLHSTERKLYDIAVAATRDRWPCVAAFEEQIKEMLVQILKRGRKSGEFERKTPLDETLSAIFLVMDPYVSPLLLPHNLENAKQAAMLLPSLILRSLAA